MKSSIYRDYPTKTTGLPQDDVFYPLWRISNFDKNSIIALMSLHCNHQQRLFIVKELKLLFADLVEIIANTNAGMTVGNYIVIGKFKTKLIA